MAQPGYWQNPFTYQYWTGQRVVTGRGRRAVADARQASLRDIRRGLQRRRPRPGHGRADQPGLRLRSAAEARSLAWPVAAETISQLIVAAMVEELELNPDDRRARGRHWYRISGGHPRRVSRRCVDHRTPRRTGRQSARNLEEIRQQERSRPLWRRKSWSAGRRRSTRSWLQQRRRACRKL